MLRFLYKCHVTHSFILFYFRDKINIKNISLPTKLEVVGAMAKRRYTTLSSSLIVMELNNFKNGGLNMRLNQQKNNLIFPWTFKLHYSKLFSPSIIIPLVGVVRQAICEGELCGDAQVSQGKEGKKLSQWIAIPMEWQLSVWVALKRC